MSSPGRNLVLLHGCLAAWLLGRLPRRDLLPASQPGAERATHSWASPEWWTIFRHIHLRTPPRHLGERGITRHKVIVCTLTSTSVCVNVSDIGVGNEGHFEGSLAQALSELRDPKLRFIGTEQKNGTDGVTGSTNKVTDLLSSEADEQEIISLL